MLLSKDPPNDDTKAIIQIIRPRPGTGVRVCILSEYWVWLPTHYNGKRTIACSSDRECKWCKSQVRTWKGFIVVREFDGTRRALLQITPNVVESINAEVGEGGKLCGLLARFYRLGKEVNAPLSVQLLGRGENELGVSWQETADHVNRIYKIRGDTTLIGRLGGDGLGTFLPKNNFEATSTDE